MLLFSLASLLAAAAALAFMSGVLGPVGGLGREIASIAFMLAALLTTLGFSAADS